MRKTINREFKLTGIGLHKGLAASVEFKPQMENEGIRFFLKDSKIPIKAALENVNSTLRGTNLSNGVSNIYTVEHILSALFAFDIDDIDIILSDIEPPALDGSSINYCKEINKVGILLKEQEERRKFVLDKKIDFSYKDSFYEAQPFEDSVIECVYENNHPLIGSQFFSFRLNSENYLKEIAPARTFGFIHEIDYLRKNNLALGGSLENAVVLSEDSILNKEPLRFKDEFVRHKILDFIGDISLMGFRLENMKIKAIKPSHNANFNFAKFLREVA